MPVSLVLQLTRYLTRLIAKARHKVMSRKGILMRKRITLMNYKSSSFKSPYHSEAFEGVGSLSQGHERIDATGGIVKLAVFLHIDFS